MTSSSSAIRSTASTVRTEVSSKLGQSSGSQNKVYSVHDSSTRSTVMSNVIYSSTSGILHLSSKIKLAFVSNRMIERISLLSIRRIRKVILLKLFLHAMSMQSSQGYWMLPRISNLVPSAFSTFPLLKIADIFWVYTTRGRTEWCMGSEPYPRATFPQGSSACFFFILSNRIVRIETYEWCWTVNSHIRQVVKPSL